MDGIPKTDDSIIKLIPFAAEAAWSTNRMDALKKFTETAPQDGGADFNVNVGRLLLHLQRGDHDGFGKITDSIKEQIGAAMTADNTSSRRACRDSLLKLHALVELDMIASMTMNREGEDSPAPERNVLRRLDIRLEALGANNYDKQYVLSLRRAAMELSRYVPSSCFMLALH